MFSQLETEKRREGRDGGAFADLQASSVSSTPGSLFNAHFHSVCVPKKTEQSFFSCKTAQWHSIVKNHKYSLSLTFYKIEHMRIM